MCVWPARMNTSSTVHKRSTDLRKKTTLGESRIRPKLTRRYAIRRRADTSNTFVSMRGEGSRPPYLVLSLVSEAQTRRPPLEALSVVRPRLVRLELHGCRCREFQASTNVEEKVEESE